jgi:hypothetical protein
LLAFPIFWDQSVHVQQLSVAEMRMLRWICGNIRRDRVRNDDIRERLGVAPVEKLVQHRLRWFGHIQRRSMEAPVRSGIIRRSTNEKRGRGRSNLIWKESVKRDLKDWCITKEFALDRREWKLAIRVGILIFDSFFFIFFCQSFFFPFFTPFRFFFLEFYCLFSFCRIDFCFYRPSFSLFFFAIVLLLFLGFISSLPQFALD